MDAEATPLSSLPPPRSRYVEGDYSTFGEYQNDELERILTDPAISPADRVALANEMLTRRLDIRSSSELLYSILRGFEGNQTRYRAAIALARMGDWNAEVWRALRHIADRYPMSHGDARMAFDILAARGGAVQGNPRTFAPPSPPMHSGGRHTPPSTPAVPLMVEVPVNREDAFAAEMTTAPMPPPRRPLPAANQPEQWEKLPTFAAEGASVRSAASSELLGVPALRAVADDEDHPRRYRRGRRSSRNKPLTKLFSNPLFSFTAVTVLVLASMLLLATCMPVQNADRLEKLGVLDEQP